MRVEDRSLIEFHLSEVTFEQGFQLKIRGNTRVWQKKKKKDRKRVTNEEEYFFENALSL